MGEILLFNKFFFQIVDTYLFHRAAIINLNFHTKAPYSFLRARLRPAKFHATAITLIMSIKSVWTVAKIAEFSQSWATVDLK